VKSAGFTAKLIYIHKLCKYNYRLLQDYI